MRPMIKTTVADAVSNAYGELTSLGEELREWADNIEEKFGSTDKYSRLDDAASTLEGLSEPTVPESLEKIEMELVEVPRGRKHSTRPKRRDRAVYELDVAVQVLQEFIDKENEKDKKVDNDAKEAEFSDALDDASTLIDEIEELKAEAENVEFPGMYG